MAEFYPLIVVGATIGVLSLLFVIAYFYVRSRKEVKEYDPCLGTVYRIFVYGS